MRTPVEWLSDYVSLPPGVVATDVADALLRIGFEVEDVHTVPETTGDLVIGQVLTIEELTEFKKPIRFVRVDVGPGHGPNGSDEPREIICGARNFAVGDKVVIALPGSVLPGGFAIASRSTYGHISDGMICSVRELGIGTEHDGILVLDANAQIGVDARGLIGSHDSVVELAITPDRGYALSIRGLARETGAALDVPFIDPADVNLPERAEAGWPVTIADAGCGRFVTVRITGIDPNVPTPFRIRRRLQAAGIRNISLAVDVTNYVMLELGHPLHAFDSGKLAGEITVRRATAGETLKTLDGTVRTLVTDDLLVTDESGPISMAGVMGGESTEISSATTDVVIEAAYWDPAVISRAARRHKLGSEASRRYERGVDPALSAVAAEAAAQLLVRYAGGEIVGRSDVVGTLPAQPVIELPLGESERLAGRPYEASVILRRLEQIGCVIDDRSADPLAVTPPTWRPDLTRPADLVEEVARLEDYATIPTILPGAPAGTGLTYGQRRERRIADDLASAGLTEVLAFPFVGTADLDALGLPADDVRRFATSLLNPLDADRPSMRTTLLPGLLDAVTRNIARGARDLSFFEIGQVFLPSSNAPVPPATAVDHRPSEIELAVLNSSLPLQPRHVAVVLAGAIERAGWWGKGRDGSWADAIELARRVGVTAGVDLRVVPAEQAPWHPGRCASIRVGDWIVGYAGELHPAVVERLGLPARSAALELDLDAIPERATPVAPQISPFPPVHLDVALVVSDEVLAADVTSALVAGGGELLELVRLFDVYTGDQVAGGSKSLAFSLVVRAPDRTLTAAEALTVRDAAVAEAARRTGAVLR
ncbi:phenylalanyl-tRNA synthetase beta subunit [Nakamurella panacisegetis]|uniref:Phenylalanine--tRNA ligase beta subunit n=1 Tax=Nakamurella panacisegetis TaxID=1090615 RepID=A0A1H0PNR6_9ACTN|nr:phenylalanine--tRNA ligase subunit beta [Nakamurella panacisegetis]SDP06761.1 phenylalanyl-tRNA synthetase beta subunit [Nakamurella panacisegetis]